MPVLPNFSHKIEAEEALSNLFYQDTVTRYPNNKEIYKKKLQTNLPMNIDVKILNLVSNSI